MEPHKQNAAKRISNKIVAGGSKIVAEGAIKMIASRKKLSDKAHKVMEETTVILEDKLHVKIPQMPSSMKDILHRNKKRHNSTGTIITNDNGIIYKDNIAFDIDDMDDKLKSASESLLPKHNHIEADENIAEVKFTMQLVDAPFPLMLKSVISAKQVTVVLNETEFVLFVKKIPILKLNYTQISKWVMDKVLCTFKFVFRRNKKEDWQHVTVKTNYEKVYIYMVHIRITLIYI